MGLPFIGYSNFTTEKMNFAQIYEFIFKRLQKIITNHFESLYYVNIFKALTHFISVWMVLHQLIENVVSNRSFRVSYLDKTTMNSLKISLKAWISQPASHKLIGAIIGRSDFMPLTEFIWNRISVPNKGKLLWDVIDSILKLRFLWRSKICVATQWRCKKTVWSLLFIVWLLWSAFTEN